MPSDFFPLVLLAGDIHGDFQPLIDAVRATRPDAVLLLGDLEAQRPLEVELAPVLGMTEIRFVHGNHDTDSPTLCDNVFSSSLASLNLHGRVDTVCGLRVGGLGGVFRQEIWDPASGEGPRYASHAALVSELDRRRPERERSGRRTAMAKRERVHLSSIFPDDVQRLSRQKADLLITHEAPTCHPHGFSVIDRLGRAMGIRALFHGHHHDSLDYRCYWPVLGFRAYGVGLRAISILENEVVGRSVGESAPAFERTFEVGP